MKKRQLTLLIIVWLFSQQLFAIVLSASHKVMDCTEYSHSNCAVDAIEHNGHLMPSSGADDANVLMTCDHCNTFCQPSIIVNNELMPVNLNHLPVTPRADAVLVNIVLAIPHRPPILA